MWRGERGGGGYTADLKLHTCKPISKFYQWGGGGGRRRRRTHLLDTVVVKPLTTRSREDTWGGRVGDINRLTLSLHIVNLHGLPTLYIIPLHIMVPSLRSFVVFESI